MNVLYRATQTYTVALYSCRDLVCVRGIQCYSWCILDSKFVCHEPNGHFTLCYFRYVTSGQSWSNGAIIIFLRNANPSGAMALHNIHVMHSSCSENHLHFCHIIILGTLFVSVCLFAILTDYNTSTKPRRVCNSTPLHFYVFKKRKYFEKVANTKLNFW